MSWRIGGLRLLGATAPAGPPPPDPVPVECPAGSVSVDSTKTTAQIQSSINSAGVGGTICYAQGSYYLTASLVPLSNQTHVGLGTRGAQLWGTTQVTPVADGAGYWSISGFNSLGDAKFPGYTDGDQWGQAHVNGVVAGPMCWERDQVFQDGVGLWQVDTKAKVLSVASPYGEPNFFRDPTKFWIGVDPAGSSWEVSTLAGPIFSNGAATGVTFQNLALGRCGTGPKEGAINVGAGMLIDNCEIAYSHSAGINLRGNGSRCMNSHIHHAGALGVHGGQSACARVTGLLLENCQIAYNNAAGYWPEVGGMKITHSDGFTVRGCFLHHNSGHSIWTDGPNINVLYENNIVEDGAAAGIYHELGYAATIRNNTVKNCGHGWPPVFGGPWAAGIQPDQSRDVQIYNNTVLDCHAGIVAIQQPPHADQCGYGATAWIENLDVHDNVVKAHNLAGGVTPVMAGLRLYQEPTDTSFLSTKNNRFENNDYYVDNTSLKFFDWSGGWGESTFTEWQTTHGNDNLGSINVYT